MRKLCFSLVLLMLTQAANASLLISPTRIMFEPKDRVKQVILVNSSNQTRSYRIGWEERTVTDTGSYTYFPKDAENPFAASPFVRYSPRQVRLEPGARQIVKLMVRRNGMPELPELRSHLRLTALPLQDETGPDISGQGANLKLNVLTSYSMPVSVRTGDADVIVGIEDIKVSNPTGQKRLITISMNKTGKYSTTGRLEAFLESTDGQRTRVGIINNINFFHEGKTREATIEWQADTPQTGDKLLVEYYGEQEFTGRVLASKSIKL